MGVREKTRMMLGKEPRKDEQMRRDVGRTQDAKWHKEPLHLRKGRTVANSIG
jgi:hypothetical protein